MNNKLQFKHIDEDYIWTAFSRDFAMSVYYRDQAYCLMNTTGKFNMFLRTLDIGVSLINYCTYNIDDPYKWMLARIKYGI